MLLRGHAPIRPRPGNMKANYELCLSGNSCIFVPYRPEHLPNYHEWMQDPFLLEMTGSEHLTMEEEIEMQKEWREDEKKCTYIVLARDLMEECDTDMPPPPQQEAAQSEEKIALYPHLVEKSLDAMIGDVNLFLSEEDESEEESEDDEQIERQQTESAQSTPKSTQAELDLMIARTSHRHKNLGTELALMMMHYGATHLQLRRFFVKIKEANHSSLKLFKEKIGFVQCAYAECFGEYELEVKCNDAQEMVEWIERRWRWWCQEGKKQDAKAGSGGRLYDVYECPLRSAEDSDERHAPNQ
ncbi:hypothetical protein ACHAXT_012072 [Thalassiosira profunda]